VFRFRTAAAACVALLGMAVGAEAATVQVRDNPALGGGVFAFGKYEDMRIHVSGKEVNVRTGPFALQYDVTGGDTFWTDFLTFCLQPHERLNLPRAHAVVDRDAYFADAAQANAIGLLYEEFLGRDLGMMTDAAAAAFQVLVWEIVEDWNTADFLDFGLGDFRILSSEAPVVMAADAIWNGIAPLLNSGQRARFQVLAADNTQDLIVSEVPVPGALLLMLTGLGGFSAARRLRRA